MKFLKAIRKKILGFFGIKAQAKFNHVAQKKEISRTASVIMREQSIFALVPGHNSKDQGATSFTYYDHNNMPTSITEYEYWCQRMINIQRELANHGIQAPIFYRPDMGTYSQQVKVIVDEIEDAAIKYSFHGHFNSSVEKALGAEVLINKDGDGENNLIADYITDMLNVELGFRERGLDGVKEISSSHRGSKMLSECAKVGCHAFILEPAFGNYANKESKILIHKPEKIERIIVNTIIAIRDGKIRDLDQ